MTARAQVDLALCSHLLLTWSDVLDRDWHEAALLELLRAAKEVRVFPVVVQGTGDVVPFLPDLLTTLRARGHRAEVLAIDDEFQRGADEMLVFHRA